MGRKRCAFVGIGHRVGSWIDPAVTRYAGGVEVVGLCDPVVRRCEDVKEQYKLASAGCYGDYDRMLAETRPDMVVVCSPEGFHADQIVKALRAGARVATEKPLCVTGADARSILAAEREAGRPVYMGFNYRHVPLCLKVKELLLGGVIGEVVSADLSWHLDYRGHGASYFRRWHAVMANSGGLLIHKGTHHVDALNWWLDDRPETVFACRGCPHAGECEFYYDADPGRKAAELGYQPGHVRDYDGDLCVWRDEVDIYDTHALTIRYARGAVVNYSLNASVPWEGWDLRINGAGGRIETGINDGKPAAGWQRYGVAMQLGRTGRPARVLNKDEFYMAGWPQNYTIQVFPHDKVAYQVEAPNIASGHGGGDEKITDGFYGEAAVENPLGAFATAIDGAFSMAVGAAANESVRLRRAVEISEILGEWASA